MNALLQHLARLASTRYQMRFVVNGTSTEYALPEELLEAAENRVVLALADDALPDARRRALQRLRTVMENDGRAVPFDDESVSNQELVERNEPWRRIRTEAAHCLEVLGFDLGQWESENA
jgi:hypothetical protein